MRREGAGGWLEAGGLNGALKGVEAGVALSPQGSPALALSPELIPGEFNSLLALGAPRSLRFSSCWHSLCLRLAWRIRILSASSADNSETSELSSLTLSFHRVGNESRGPPYLPEGGPLLSSEAEAAAVGLL